ncbi:MAG TPA: hypothetical protein VMK31_09480 [Sphingomicrobium sp.]|nr:hypothetical protein [Sphingomicrobium sp.]
MTDTRYSRRPLAAWYWVAATASLLIMAVGCAYYLFWVTSDPTSLPIDQRAAIAAEPLWVTSAFAVAVWTGLAGSALLLVRRKIAQPLLLVSVIAVAAWLAGLLAVAELRRLISANDIAVAIGFAAIVWTIFWFARHSSQRGWLR